MRKHWGILAYIQLVSHQPFVGVYEYAFDREFKELFTERVIFKDDHTAFDVNMYEIRIWTVRPKNTINVFLRETDWILSRCAYAGRRLYLPLLRQLLKLNYKPPKET